MKPIAAKITGDFLKTELGRKAKRIRGHCLFSIIGNNSVESLLQWPLTRSPSVCHMAHFTPVESYRFRGIFLSEGNEMKPEPFGYFKPEPFGWTDCSETDEGAVAMYEQSAIDELMETIEGYKQTELLNRALSAEKFKSNFENELIIEKLEERLDELMDAANAIEINSEECLDWDDSTAMLVPIDDYHKLMEAIAKDKP